MTMLKVRFGLPEVTDRTHRKENVHDQTLGEVMGASDLTTFMDASRLETFKDALRLLGSAVLSVEELPSADLPSVR